MAPPGGKIVNKREHFERWMKYVKPNMPLDYNDSEWCYYHDIVSMMWQAWQASSKTRPTEPSKITKEQLAAMKADTSNIVDHLRGIYPGIADAYPVTPLMRKAADEIERLRLLAGEFPGEDRDELVRRTIHRLAEYLKTTKEP
jgi:hypothetical protein